MFENVIVLLISICLVVGACWLVIWVLGELGVSLPAQVIKIFWVIAVLIVLLLLYRALAPALGGRFSLLISPAAAHDSWINGDVQLLRRLAVFEPLQKHAFSGPVSAR